MHLKIKVSHGTSFFFVGNEGGELHPCQDYRYLILNEHNLKNTHPIPNMARIRDKPNDSKFFTKLDIRQGYNNVRIHKGDKWKAAFRTPEGLYKMTVMFFGMTNLPATFQSMMNSFFKDLIDNRGVIIYMENILIYGITRQQLSELTKEVLKILQKNNLYFKTEKCEFETQRLEYLRVIICPNSIKMDPVKLKGIEEWPVPKTAKNMWEWPCGCTLIMAIVPNSSLLFTLVYKTLCN